MTLLLVATRSAHKLREIQDILAPLVSVRLVDLDAAGIAYHPEEEHVERFDTFDENARAKARYFSGRSGMPVLADDSGLCVDALDGAPGVRSKRFSGRSDLTGQALDAANNDQLLAALRGVPAPARTARYVCCVAFAGHGVDATWEGECHGLILEERRGTGGFGYDPLFLVPGENATFGEISQPRKNRLSHRAAALRNAAPLLRELLEPPLT